MTLFLNHWLLDSHLEGTTVNRRISLVSELLNKIYSVQRSSRQVQAWSCGGCLLFTALSVKTHPDGHLGSFERLLMDPLINSPYPKGYCI